MGSAPATSSTPGSAARPSPIAQTWSLVIPMIPKRILPAVAAMLSSDSCGSRRPPSSKALEGTDRLPPAGQGGQAVLAAPDRDRRRQNVEDRHLSDASGQLVAADDHRPGGGE